LILLLYDGRLYRILAAAAGLDDWTGADSPGIQQLVIVPTSARSMQSDIAVIWVPPPDGSPSPYAAAHSELLVYHRATGRFTRLHSNLIAFMYQ
jgi:hypothetical protein